MAWALGYQLGPSLLGERRVAIRVAIALVLVLLLTLGVLTMIVPVGKNGIYGPGAGSVFSSAVQQATISYVNSSGGIVTVPQTVTVPVLDGNGQPIYMPLRYPNGSIIYINGEQQNQTDRNGAMIPMTTQQPVVGPPALLPEYAGYGPNYKGVDTGDTCWMLVSAILVLLMTPGLAFFYSGMVQAKNMVSTLFQSYISIAIVSLLWVFIGFTLAFGPDWGGMGILGDPSAYYFYRNVGVLPIPYDLNNNLALPFTIPWSIYSIYQLGFAAVTPAIITGSFAERVRFGPVCLFLCLWHLVVYCPIAHVVWSPNGLLKWWGSLDFAGGTVVHMSSGFAALVGAWYIGRRTQFYENHFPASIPYVMLGTAMLWFGWFGFNAGSAGTAGGLAGQAWVNTNAAAASCMASWVLLDVVYDKPASALTACIGALVGLIVITPGSGYVTVGAAIIEGIIGALVCYHVQNFIMPRSSVDDALDSFTAHGAGGLVGFVLVGCFANPEVNPIYDNGGHLMVGLFYGGTGANSLIVKQLVALVGLVPYVMFASYVCFKITDLIYPLRIDSDDEHLGLDAAQQGLGVDCSAPMMSPNSLPRLSRTPRPSQYQTKLAAALDRSVRSERSSDTSINMGPIVRSSSKVVPVTLDDRPVPRSTTPSSEMFPNGGAQPSERSSKRLLEWAVVEPLHREGEPPQSFGRNRSLDRLAMARQSNDNPVIDEEMALEHMNSQTMLTVPLASARRNVGSPQASPRAVPSVL